jgi:hypothetical protein
LIKEKEERLLILNKSVKAYFKGQYELENKKSNDILNETKN